MRPLGVPLMKRARIAIAWACGFAGVSAITLGARAVGSDPLTAWGLLVSVPGAALAVVCLGSFYEWTLHRYLYHGRSRWRFVRLVQEIHEMGHHWHRFPPDRYVHRPPVERIPVLPAEPFGLCGTRWKRLVAWWGQFALYLAVAIPFAFVPAWLVSRNRLFTSCAVATGVVLCYLFIAVHDAIHYPAGRWIERRGWFRFLDRHHYLHHIHHGANLNFLLPLGDLLFGTLRRELGAAELGRWPPFEEVKKATGTS